MKKNNVALTIMAAGMGSRFGGLKQITPMTNDGRTILDFSLHDALESGFNKFVFIIKKEIEKDFREAVGKRAEKLADTEYVFQEKDACLPDAYKHLAETRLKPWGTGHAILCAENALKDMPFAVINADDYYGKNGYKVLYDHLTTSDEFCMCGFKLKNTLTDNGTVARGICEVENGYLKSITEHTSLDKNSPFAPDTVVSMNLFGLNPRIFTYLNENFEPFLKNLENPAKDEFFLPAVIDKALKQNGEQLKVLESDDKWYGVTYKEDAEYVKAALKAMIEKGMYHADRS